VRPACGSSFVGEPLGHGKIEQMLAEAIEFIGEPAQRRRPVVVETVHNRHGSRQEA
jgi:hypothetical protein